MKTNVLIFAIGFLFASCAKIPIQSISLINNIQDEGKRMHTLNITLTNKIFSEKRNTIDDFIKKEYTPKMVAEFTKRIPDNIDIKAELPNIIASILPKINARRDSMQSVLEGNRIKMLDKLNEDFLYYDSACIEMQNLLSSAVKLEYERKKIIAQATSITKNNIDFEKLEGTIDRFVKGSGDFGKDIVNLNESVNGILNK